jgi:hypothetical protein
MIERSLASSVYRRTCLFVLYFIVAAASFNGFYDKWHFGEADVAGEDYRFPIDRMVDGTAYRPYVYRQMLPTVADWLDSAAPPRLKAWLYEVQSGGPGAIIDPLFDSATAENPVYFFRYLVAYAGTFLFALLALYAMRQVCVAAEIPGPAAALAPVILLLLIPFFQSVGGFFYDYAELAFFAIAFWMTMRLRWGWMIPVAALATWNKESFLLFVPTLYPLLRSRNSRASASAAVGVLGLASMAVYLPIRMRFAANPGGQVELHWREQLISFLHPVSMLFNMEKTYGLLLPRAFTLLALALCAWTVARAWRRFSSALKNHAMIAAGLNLPLYFLFCWPGELRNLSMLFIVLLFGLAYGLADWLAATRAD